MRGTTLVRRFFEETINCGGLPLRRADALRITIALEYCPLQVDWFVWGKPVLQDVAPLPLACAAAIMGLSPALLATQ